MAASAYHILSKEAENNIVRHNWVFRHACCTNNLHWESSGIIMFLCKYIVTLDTLVDCFLDVLFLLLVIILSGLHEKPRRNKDWVTDKIT